MNLKAKFLRLPARRIPTKVSQEDKQLKNFKYTYCILSFSKRGGGASFAVALLSTFPNSATVVGYSIKSTSRRKFESDYQSEPIVIPHTFMTLDWIKFMFHSVFQIWKLMKSSEVTVLPMPHPIDPIVLFIAKLTKSKVAVIIHDAQPHIGECWPTSRSIRRRINSANLSVTLSESEANKLEARGLFSLTCAFPYLVGEIKPQQPYVLRCGRMKLYQNLEFMLESWKIASSYIPDYHLVIAGENLNTEYTSDNVVYLNFWIEETKLEKLISESALVALPYSEATQSGIFMQAVSFGTPIAVTPVIGLIEQANKYSSALVCEELTPESFATAIIEGVKLQRGGVFIENKPSFIRALDAYFEL